MKIEVTFDKSSKKEFRDQCIKRLQNFVTQIKGKQEADNTRRNSIVSAFQESKGSTFRDHPYDNWQYQQDYSSLPPANREAKVYKKQNSLARTENTGKAYAPKESRKQNRIPQPAETSKSPSHESKFNICEIRQNVNKILQKLDKNACFQAANHQNLEEKLEETNIKLDYLIQCIETKGITHAGNSKSDLALNKQEQRSRKTFQEKFNHLANKYYEIRERNTKSVSIFSKSITSLQQTQDSVTFRHI